MNRGQTILFNYSLRDQNRVLEVVTIPGHERDTHVLAQCQFTEINRRTIRQNIAALHRVTDTDNRTLVNAGVLVRALVLG